jgi:hypothetical protein
MFEMKKRKPLSVNSFSIDNPEWPSSQPSAKIEINGLPVTLSVTSRVEISQLLIDLFEQLIQAWPGSEPAIRTKVKNKFPKTKTAEKFDLRLWAIEIFLDEDDEFVPTLATFYLHVLVDNKRFTTVGVLVDIDDHEPEWKKYEISELTDFDR